MAKLTVEDTSLQLVSNKLTEKSGNAKGLVFPQGFIDEINTITNQRARIFSTKKEMEESSGNSKNDLAIVYNKPNFEGIYKYIDNITSTGYPWSDYFRDNYDKLTLEYIGEKANITDPNELSKYKYRAVCEQNTGNRMGTSILYTTDKVAIKENGQYTIKGEAGSSLELRLFLIPGGMEIIESVTTYDGYPEMQLGAGRTTYRYHNYDIMNLDSSGMDTTLAKEAVLEKGWEKQ